MRRSSRRAERATSLVEMLVCLTLVGLLLGSIAAILQSGVRYYLSSTKTTDIQQACLLVATELATELSEGSYRAIYSQEHVGVIFASARNKQGTVDFNGTSLLWQKLVCYYVSPSADGGYALVRKEQYFSDMNPCPPELAGTVDMPPYVPDQFTCQFFASQASLVPRTIASYIYDLDVVHTDPLYVSIGAQDTTLAYRVAVSTVVKNRN